MAYVFFSKAPKAAHRMTLRVSNVSQEGVFQGSKWLKIQLLCDASELADLFEKIAPFYIFPLTGIVDGKPISSADFINEYARWIDELKNGKVPKDGDLKKILACAFVDDLDALWLQPVPKGFLTKIAKPTVQVQSHFFSYSKIDGVFRPLSMGSESVFWGLQFSFPQIYQDPKTMELLETKEKGLFKKIQIWARDATRATPFVVDKKRTNSPIRLGKKCFSWINAHPQLVEQKIEVYAN